MKIVQLICALSIYSLLIITTGCNGKVNESGFGSIAVPPPPAAAIPPSVLPGTSNGLLDDASFFYVGVDTSVGAIAHVHSTLGFNTNCGINKSDTGNKDIACIVEIPEGDLYLKDLELKFNAPPGMCRYMDRRPYWFYNHEVGQGPRTINVTITNVYNASGDLTPGGTSQTCTTIDGVGPADPGCDSHSEATSSPASLTSTSTSFKCIYDRTAAGGPNCCFGAYTLNTTVFEDRSAVVPATPSTSTTTPSLGNWGGDYATCIGGPGKTDWTSHSSGIPNPVTSYTEAGITDKQIITAAGKFALGSNVHGANYYSGAGGVAGSADHTHTGFVGNLSSSNRPYFMAPINDRSGSGISQTQDSFEFQCLDSAYEVKHRIRVYVREWDTYPDYLAYVSSQGVAVVPDRGLSPEPGTNCNAIANVGYLCNDFYDNDDFLNLALIGTALPGPPLRYDMSVITKRVSYFPGLSY